jgi:hypothetical protein
MTDILRDPLELWGGIECTKPEGERRALALNPATH